MGRPTKLTEERQEAICNLLRQAVSIEAACAVVGVDESQYYRWRQRGEEELKRVEAGHANCRVRQGEERYVEFYKETTRAHGEAEETLVKRIFDAGDWRAAMELLQRKYPDRWGKTQKLEHSGNAGIVVNLISDEEDE